MSVMTVTTRITRHYLENKTKSDLAQMYLDLLDEMERIQFEHCQASLSCLWLISSLNPVDSETRANINKQMDTILKLVTPEGA